jgi:hypothetical protein
MAGGSEERRDEPGRKPSWGNIGEHHWSRARRDANREALEYYRQRSHAPGVREGGAERNFYCMACDGVIPHAPALERCPHCGAALDPDVKRYFNWVEVDQRTGSDFRALLPVLLGGLALLVVAALLALRWLA